MPPGVVGIHEAVVIDEIAVPRVVRRIDIDALDPPGVGHAEISQGVEIVALNDQVPPRRIAGALLGNQVQGRRNPH